MDPRVAPPGDLLPLRQLDLLESSQLPIRPSAHLPILDQRARGTEFIALTARSVLNSPASTGMGFWSLNPYVGCEFGCTYCYARDTHRWVMERRGGGAEWADGQMGSETTTDGAAVAVDLNAETPTVKQLPIRPSAHLPPWEAFEHRILVKTEVAAVLARTLDPAKLAGCTLVIGTATDPYQPAERKFRLTRQLLERLMGYRGLSIGLITKSPLVARDLDVLQRLAERHEVSVNISLSSLNARLLRRLELRSPVPRARLRALKALTDGGIHAGLLIAPIIPGLTDDRPGLAALMAAGKAAGARYVVGAALRLGPAARSRFLPHLAREFPELVERYRRRYGSRQYAGRDYTDALARRLRRLQREYGFPVDEGMRRRRQLEGPAQEEATPDEQGVLL